jgi:hypothetical protein
MFGLHVDDVLAIVYAKGNQRKHEDAIFLKNAMEQCGYTVKVNYAGIDQAVPPTKYKIKYTGINIRHDLEERVVIADMNDYYEKMIATFENEKPRETPGKPCDIKYGAKEQHEHLPLPTTFTKEQKLKHQQDTGAINWYSTVAPDIKVQLSRLQSQTENPTQETIPTMEFLKGYLKTYGKHEIHFRASDMKLVVFADSSFDSEPNSRSRCGGIGMLVNSDMSVINGPIFAITNILPGVPNSAAEAEIAGNYTISQHLKYCRKILNAIGFPQDATPLLNDNIPAIDFANDTTRGRKLKMIARRYNGLQHDVNCRITENIWVTSLNNLADLMTKLFGKQRNNYLAPLIVTRHKMLTSTNLDLQGCIAPCYDHDAEVIKSTI